MERSMDGSAHAVGISTLCSMSSLSCSLGDIEDECEEELYFINYGIKYRMGDELMEQREES